MFRRFEDFFGIKPVHISALFHTPYRSFINKYGDTQFAQGLFNVFSQESVDKMSNLVFKAYPRYAGGVSIFGYDWLGRIFGIARKNGKELVLMFEIGTLKVLEIPCDFISFLNVEIPNYHQDCLASDYFKQWLQVSSPPQKGHCIGYKIPLFLGGEDALANLEDSDMEVYWYLMSEISRKIM